MYTVKQAVEVPEEIRGFSINDFEQVSEFLNNYPFLLRLLPTIKDKIEIYFGEAQVYLEVTTDPEIAGESSLEVAISPLDEPGQTLIKLQQFDREWWLQAMSEAQDKLYITVEYK
jgi:hypothetical protein